MKLVSAEGAEFWVDRKCAMVSGTIKAMLSGEGNNSNTSTTVQYLSIVFARRLSPAAGVIALQSYENLRRKNGGF